MFVVTISSDPSLSAQELARYGSGYASARPPEFPSFSHSLKCTRVNSDRALLGVWPMSGTIREGGGLEQRTGTGLVLWCKVYSYREVPYRTVVEG